MTLAEIEAAQAEARQQSPASSHDQPRQAAQNVQHQTSACWSGCLPYPPTLNRYYRHVGAKVLISRHGREYRKALERLLRGCQRIGGSVAFTVLVYPPDNRRRDLDNLLKGLQDALVHAGLLADDSQIKRLEMAMMGARKPDGCVQVTISRISGTALDQQSKGET